MTKAFSAFFAALIAFFKGTEEIAHAYSSVCRTARAHAEAYEKESDIEIKAKLDELEKKYNKQANNEQ